jgi:hypothetical protein
VLVDVKGENKPGRHATLCVTLAFNVKPLSYISSIPPSLAIYNIQNTRSKCLR